MGRQTWRLEAKEVFGKVGEGRGGEERELSFELWQVEKGREVDKIWKPQATRQGWKKVDGGG